MDFAGAPSEPSAATTCPPRGEWARFLAGDVSARRQSALARHLEACEACLRIIEDVCGQVDDDGLVASALTSRPSDASIAGPDFEAFRERILAQARSAAEGEDLEQLRRVVGDRFGRFILRERLGHGGSGIVWKAYDPKLCREVAIKVPREFEGQDRRAQSRHIREARAAARLSHPNIVPILDAGRVRGIPYIAMEYCPGPNLAEWQRQRREPVPARLAARIVASLAGAVAEAHQQGILHRDIKPTNVLLYPAPEGVATDPEFGYQMKLADFGAARIGLGETLGRDQDASLAASLAGTPEYMAPEVAAGRGTHSDPRVDVWALGAVLYHLLTGRPPFQGEDVRETLRLAAETEPTAPRLLRPGLPRDLETILQKCLSRSPDARYHSSASLADDLQRWLDGRPISARPISPIGRGWRCCRRRPVISILVASLFSSLVLGLAISLLLWSRAEASRTLAGGYLKVTTDHLDDLVQATTRRSAWDRSVRETLSRARDTYRELCRRDPQDRQSRMTLAQIDHRLALQEQRRFRPGPRVHLLEEAVSLVDGLAGDDRERRLWGCELRVDLGVALWDANRLDDSIRSLRETARLIDSPGWLPTGLRTRRLRAMTQRHLGVALLEKGEMEEGLQIIGRGWEPLRDWVAEKPDDAAAVRAMFWFAYYSVDEMRMLANVEGLYRAARSSSDPGVRVLSAWAITHELCKPAGPEIKLLHAYHFVEMIEPAIEEMSRAAARVEDPGFVRFTANLEGHLVQSLRRIGREREAESWSERAFHDTLRYIGRWEDDDTLASWFTTESAYRALMMMTRPERPISLEDAANFLMGLCDGIGARTNRPDLWRSLHALTLLNLAYHLRGSLDRVDESRALIRRSWEILEPLSKRLVGEPLYHLAMSEFWTQQAKTELRGTDRCAAQVALERSERAAREAFRLDPDSDDDRYRVLLDDRLARLAKFHTTDRRFLVAESVLLECGGLWIGRKDHLPEVRERLLVLARAIQAAGLPSDGPLRACHDRCYARAVELTSQIEEMTATPERAGAG